MCASQLRQKYSDNICHLLEYTWLQSRTNIVPRRLAVGRNLSSFYSLRTFRVVWPIVMPLLACELHYYIFDGSIAHCKRLYEDFIITVVNCEIFCGNKPLALCLLQTCCMSQNPLRVKTMISTDISWERMYDLLCFRIIHYETKKQKIMLIEWNMATSEKCWKYSFVGLKY